MLDFISFRNKLVKLSWFRKLLSLNHPLTIKKIRTTKADRYRVIIHFLKESDAQYHTYQLRDEKSSRIVIYNLHPSIPTVAIGIIIKEGYTVRQVANVKYKTTRNKLLIFFYRPRTSRNK